MVLYATTLIPVSLLPAFLGMAGPAATTVAAILGVLFVFATMRFAAARTAARARTVLRASLIYLPILLLALVIG
jgi:protoheme IX farnesyltransferase